ncbi:uncharacterized protein LOC123549843 [Mercenaria mercenaria]|uniref:uncharacterized protein LOC123549843 n=1 Tax=Mercenaria mercenaria TaxID=6596 RepID=UPI00234ECE83|nr:uncharacterized protein LOC123549843 [Mercenaria mercenaria]
MYSDSNNKVLNFILEKGDVTGILHWRFHIMNNKKSNSIVCMLLLLGVCLYFRFIYLNLSTNRYDKSAARVSFNKTKYTSLTPKQNSCKETFNRTLEDNLNVIQNYPVGNASKYLMRLGIYRVIPNQLRKFPVFVTAFDSSHYNESQGFFKCLHENFLYNPKYKGDVLIVVYDMGLTELQRKTVQKYCKCEMRTLQFERYPTHVRTLSTYAFKPIIIQESLMDFGFVWWIDTSIRFMTTDIDSQIEYAKTHSFFYVVSRNFLAKTGLTKNTLNATFDFLHEDHCKFRPFHEIWGGVILFHFDRISRAIAQAWVTCALNELCIAPKGSENKRACDEKQNYDGRCHRFDQSAISIITRRLFHNSDYPIDINLTLILKTKRDENVQYFI